MPATIFSSLSLSLYHAYLKPISSHLFVKGPPLCLQHANSHTILKSSHTPPPVVSYCKGVLGYLPLSISHPTGFPARIYSAATAATSATTGCAAIGEGGTSSTVTSPTYSSSSLSRAASWSLDATSLDGCLCTVSA